MSVFRVAGLPAGASWAAAEEILNVFFGPETRSTLRSLGLHPQRNSLVAVAMFSPTPSSLAKGSSWTLEKTITYLHEPGRIRLEVDTAFLGFTPLNIVDKDQADQVDCIIVSGLSSHPFGSWKARGGQFMWLVDDEAANPRNVRVLLYGYDTSLVGSESFQGIADIGIRLAFSIRSIRSPPPSTTSTQKSRPLVFIAHSLGGLVVKEALCHMVKEDLANAVCTCGLVMFGVPNQGLLIEPWLRIVEKQPNKGLVENLRPGSRYLHELDVSFRDVFPMQALSVVTVYEMMTSHTTKEESPGIWARNGEREVLVNPASARGTWPDNVSQVRIGMNRTHEDLPKFRGQFDEDYLSVRPYIEQLWSTAESRVKERVTAAEQPADAATSSFDEDGNGFASAELLTGLVQLWPSKETEEVTNIPTNVDIIAIHGFGGHALSTWMEGDKLWLRDFLPSEHPKARVLTFGYDGRQIFTASTVKVRDFGLHLLESIKRDRQSRKQDLGRKTIFVCHSLGGIVLKQALVLSQNNPTRYGDVGESIGGVIFLGTPHKGISNQYWSNLLTTIARLHKVQPDIIPNLESKAIEIGDICSKFDRCAMGVHIFSLYEKYVVPNFESLIVEDSLAMLHLPTETPLPLDADHGSMGRYLTSSSSNYLIICSCIAELLDAAGGSPAQISFDSLQRQFVSGLRAVNAADMLMTIPPPWGKSAQWLLKRPDFKSWTQLQGLQVLWLHGQPGSGKTILMRSAVTYLLERSDSSNDSIIRKPLYFFFDDKDLARKSSEAFVRSILHQILSDDGTAFLAKYLDGRDYSKDARSEEQLWECLSIMIERSRGIVFQLVVDAVDEVLRNSAGLSLTIIDRLERLVALDSSGRVRVLISSRNKPPHEFCGSDFATVDVQNDETHDDLERYVREQVRRALERSYISVNAGRVVENRILDISQGNFLHATLAWKQFSQGVSHWSREQIRESLSRLNGAPKSLLAIYSQLLESILPSYRQRAKAAFAILRVSREKLLPRELSFFATLYCQDLSVRRSDLLDLVETQSADLESYLSEACGHLLRIADDGTVNFTHVSAKDLLSETAKSLEPRDRQILSQYTMSDGDANAMMYSLCMAVLRMEQRREESWEKHLTVLESAKNLTMYSVSNYASESVKSQAILKTCVSHIRSMGKTPCFLYALRYWVYHYEEASPSDAIDDAMAAYVPRIQAAYQHILWFNAKPSNQDFHLNTYSSTHMTAEVPKAYGLFHLLAMGDCPRVVRILIEDGLDVNCIADEKESVSLLSWAILCSRRQSFCTLLRAENIQINYGRTWHLRPIHHAIRRPDDLFFIQKLLERPEINVNIRPDVNKELTYDVGTPLHWAMHGKNVGAVDLLLTHPDIDIWIPNIYDETPYGKTFKNDIWLPALEKMLTISSTKSLTQRVSDTSQLLMAGVHGWTRVEEIILKTDPHQVLVVDQFNKMNALALYAYFGRHDKLLWILERLPAVGVPLRNKSDHYDLLHLCAHQNWEDVVHLLQRKFRLKSLASDHIGRNLLHYAIENNWDMSKISMDEYSVSNLDAKDRDGQTAAHLAVLGRNINTLELLVSSGANILARDKTGMTPVHLAAETGYRAALEFFIDMPKREFGRTQTGATLLHIIALWFDGTLLRRFVRAKRALVHVVDQHRRTPLHYAAMVNNVAAVKELLRLGSPVDPRDGNSMTPLHEAIRCGSSEAAQCLMRRDANTSLTDGFGQTCLHLSLRNGFSDLTTLFLDPKHGHGVDVKLDVNAVDRFGMTLLHRACHSGLVYFINALIKRGAKWRAKNIYDRTPIDIAVERRNTPAVAAMVKSLKNTDPSSRRVRRYLYDALWLALEFEFSDIEKILHDSGARIDRSKFHARDAYRASLQPEPGRWPLIVRRDRRR